MFRTTCFVATGAVCAMLLSAIGSAQPKGIDTAKPFPGELGNNKQTVYYRAPGATSGIGSGTMYVASNKVRRKAGESIFASVTVTGQNRLVGLMVLDTKGKQIFGEGEEVTLTAKRTATIGIGEVSAEGLYTVIVFSDAVGPYTLTVGSSEEDLSKKGLEAKIARLKKELAEAETALKAFDEKEQKK